MNKIYISIFLFFFIWFNKVLNINANDDTYINSSNVTYNEKENTIELAENSKINFNEINILIDRGIIDYNKNEFKVFGNFYLYENINVLSGKNLQGDTNLSSFKANNVSYLYNNNLKIDSKNLLRNGNFLYFYDNFLTPCELEGFLNCPTWSLRIDKSKYDIEKDKFIHFDSFLQVFDYKLIYLPYLSHYGSKAPRQKGFLTPSLEFNIGTDSSIKLPYYLPFDQSSEVILTPILKLNQNFEVLDNYSLETIFNKKLTGGDFTLSINSIKNENSNTINNTIKVKTKQVLDRDRIFFFNTYLTNNISTSRSNNEEPLKFEDMYIGLENYNLMKNNDYFKGEISSIKSFDTSEINQIPLVPNINYYNHLDFKKHTLTNDVELIVIKRDESKDDSISEGLKLNIENNILFNNKVFKNTFYNKLKVNNSFDDYTFEHNKSLDSNHFQSVINFSSETFLNINKNTRTQLKFIQPLIIKKSDKKINEESKSLTFNYYNQFSENRFFGNDLIDESSRIVLGINNQFNFQENNFDLNINQSFDFDKNSEYLNYVNQNSNFSDYALKLSTNSENIDFKIDARVDQEKLSRKEMNYSIDIKNPLEMNIEYNETDRNAYQNYSNDTKSLSFNLNKELNSNTSIKLNTSLDAKNDFSPYSSNLTLSLFDECSRFNIQYSNSRYNDNFNTVPEEKIGLSFYMDYLGFFNYEQSTDLFFEEYGNFDYGTL